MNIKSFMTAIIAVASISAASAQSSMSVVGGEYTQGEQAKVSVVLDNQNHFTGFQMDAVYPEGWTVKIVKGAKTKVTDEDDEPIYSTSWKNNIFILYTTQRQEIENGEVAVVQVTATSDGELKLVNIKGAGSGDNAVPVKMDDIVIGFEGGKYATGISNVTVSGEKVAAYNLAGQKVDNNYKGIVIKNGKKFVK